MESYFGAARRPEAMRLLLDAGLPADGHPPADRSPWMGAVEVKALGIAPLLVDHGAGLDVGRPPGTPLTSAATSLQLESPH